MCNLYSITTNQSAIIALSQRPLADDAMKIVARGADKEDKAAA